MKRWSNMAKNGKNKQEKKKEQTRLKGRGKRVRTGIAPMRGNGRTTHGHR